MSFVKIADGDMLPSTYREDRSWIRTTTGSRPESARVSPARTTYSTAVS